MTHTFSYAAFIITYERPEILTNTIKAVLSQSYPPSKLLIVDNSFSKDTEQLIKGLNNPIIEYFGVGYNSGPAGGAYFGLSKLAYSDYEWILWVDDDNPPDDNLLIERLIEEAMQYNNIESVGVIGSVGSDFDFAKGQVRRITNKELLSHRYLEVKCVAGGMFPLVRSEVVRMGAYPNKDFFFGFEELDFCLKVLSLGFRIIVPSEIMMERRKLSGRWNLQSKITYLPMGALWRQYYSARNMTYLFSHTYFNSWVIMRYFLRYLIKSLLSYSKGLQYGWRATSYIFLGYFHGILGKMGKTIIPSFKHSK
ncbi:MAG: hypothetical protein KatS3mg032_0007 [Cyclobacteriaceae bacterium]|nr:MAG: hypothetical protein KatS3mg032_0007 [Cyclobacteriaceae bacterium]